MAARIAFLKGLAGVWGGSLLVCLWMPRLDSVLCIKRSLDIKSGPNRAIRDDEKCENSTFFLRSAAKYLTGETAYVWRKCVFYRLKTRKGAFDGTVLQRTGIAPPFYSKFDPVEL